MAFPLRSHKSLPSFLVEDDNDHAVDDSLKVKDLNVFFYSGGGNAVWNEASEVHKGTAKLTLNLLVLMPSSFENIAKPVMLCGLKV